MASNSSRKVHTSLGSSAMGMVYTDIFFFFLFIEVASSGWYSEVCACHCVCCLPGTSCTSSKVQWAFLGTGDKERVTGSCGCNNSKGDPHSVLSNHSWRLHQEMGCGWLGPAPVVEAAPQNPLWGFFQPSSSHRDRGKTRVESAVWGGRLKCAAGVWVNSGEGCSELVSPASCQSLWPPGTSLTSHPRAAATWAQRGSLSRREFGMLCCEGWG